MEKEQSCNEIIEYENGEFVVAVAGGRYLSWTIVYDQWRMVLEERGRDAHRFKTLEDARSGYKAYLKQVESDYRANNIVRRIPLEP